MSKFNLVAFDIFSSSFLINDSSKRAISAVSFLVALGLLYFDVGVKWKAWAVALLILGTSFAVIDYFSKERANGYRAVLEQAKK